MTLTLLFIAPSLSPKCNVENVYTKYSVSLVFALSATLKKGDDRGGGGGGEEKSNLPNTFWLSVKTEKNF